MRWDPADVRAFRDRDWSAFERHPVPLDPRQSHALAGELYAQVRASVPGWPTEQDRDRDLAAHVALVSIFARVHDARCRRSAR